MSGQKKIEGAGDERFKFLAVDDGVEETVFEQEFGALKAFGEFLANGLLDDARAGESNERPGLANVEISEHREADGNAAGGGIGKDGNVRQSFLIHTRKGRANFAELHKADTAVQDARPTRAGNGEEGR